MAGAAKYNTENTFSGAGWGDNPTNDPEQRGDADGDGQRPAVNSEGFDAKYTGDGTDIWAKPGKVTNV